MAKKSVKKEVCMACSCPCEIHKEHNHPVSEKNENCCDGNKDGKSSDCCK